MSSRRALISVFIVGVLAMQMSTFLTGSRVWPFMAYCMYYKSWGSTDLHTTHHRIICIADDDTEHDVDTGLTGLQFYALKERHIQPLVNDEPQAAAALAQRIALRQPWAVRAFRIESLHAAVTADGIERTPSTRRVVVP